MRQLPSTPLMQKLQRHPSNIPHRKSPDESYLRPYLGLGGSTEASWTLLRFSLYQATDELHSLLSDIFVLRIDFPDLVDIRRFWIRIRTALLAVDESLQTAGYVTGRQRAV